MRDGCAGFFTAEELAAGKGIVHTALDLKPVPGVKPDGWAPLVPLRDESLTDAQVDALRAGDLVAAFGPEFAAREPDDRRCGCRAGCSSWCTALSESSRPAAGTGSAASAARPTSTPTTGSSPATSSTTR